MEAEMAPHQHYQSPTRYLPDRYTFYGASQEDLPAIVYLLNQRQFSPAIFRVEELRYEWLSTRFNPAMDVRLVFDPREYLVGFIQVSLDQNQPFLWGCVHPDYEGRGIGSALLCWGEARVRLELDNSPVSQWFAPHFAALSVQRAHELCEMLGWQQITPRKKEMKRVTGALHLPENANRAVDVFEKAIAE
jgi:GNAT superfamily N-acetyltransferase